MDSRRGKRRVNVEGDRLSNLPDDLLHNILAFIDVKQAIEISALSSRWRYVWTSMSCLTFSNEGFGSLSEFSKFVKHVLSARNNQTQVHSVKFSFSGKVNDAYSKRILDRIFSSHNVQQLDITCLPAKNGFNMTQSRLSDFSSHTLKNLTLSGCVSEHFLRAPHTWYLPALTTLYLRCVTLYGDNPTNNSDGLFSDCANLKNLTLEDCGTTGQWNGFSIRHDGLSNLTLVDGCDVVNVVTPQLQNLTIINWSRVHLVSAPELASLRYKEDDDDIDCVPLKVSTDLPHLEKVDVCIQCSYEDMLDTHRIVRLLQQLHNVKFLTLNLELVKFLSSSLEVITHQPSPFTDLKSLKIYPADVTKPEITMSTEVKNYLLDGSQGATFTLVSYEERAVKNVTSVSKLMTELQVLLDQWKESCETNSKMKWQFGGRMTRSGGARVFLEWVHKIVGASPPAGDNVDPPLMTRGESYWEGLNEQLEKGYKNFGRAISMLRKIEEELTKLPRSCRAKLQAQFSNLCAETDTIMDNMVDHLKIQCYKKPRLL